MATTTRGTIWPETLGGATAIGQCKAGYSIFVGFFPSPNLPSRKCVLAANNQSSSWEVEKSECEATCLSAGGCQNGGTCFQGFCLCDFTHFSGRLCENAAVLTCDAISCLNSGACIPGATPNDPATCDCSKTQYIGATCDILLVAIIALPVAIGVTLLIYLVLHRFYPKAKNSVVLSFALALYDFVTDCVFMISQAQKDPSSPLFFCSLAFIIIPLLFNLFIVGRVFIASILHQPEMGKWLKENAGIASAVAIFASTNVEIFAILHSNLLYKDAFNAPFDARAMKMISIAGFVGSLLEDVPQLVIQSIAASDHFDTITLLSIVASILTIFFGIFKRGLMFLVANFGAKPKVVATEELEF